METVIPDKYWGWSIRRLGDNVWANYIWIERSDFPDNPYSFTDDLKQFNEAVRTNPML